MDLVVKLECWYAYWFIVWGIFNFVLIPKGIFLSKKHEYAFVFFIFSSIIPIIILKYYILLAILPIFTPIIAIYRNNMNSDVKEYLTLASDVFFQQLCFIILKNFITDNVTFNQLASFILIVTCGHLPILLCKHAHLIGRTFILLVIPFGAFFMYLALNNLIFPYGLIASGLVHYFYYVLLFNFEKRRHPLGLVIIK